jgi:hypothetical protein
LVQCPLSIVVKTTEDPLRATNISSKVSFLQLYSKSLLDRVASYICVPLNNAQTEEGAFWFMDGPNFSSPPCRPEETARFCPTSSFSALFTDSDRAQCFVTPHQGCNNKIRSISRTRVDPYRGMCR